MAVRLIKLFDYNHGPGVLDRVPLTHFWGFDAAERFLNLGVGLRKQLSTSGGDTSGMSIVVSPTAICTLVEQPNLTDKMSNGRTGFITLEGVAEGDATISLLDSGGKTVDRVAIKVVKNSTVKTRFYNLVDGKGRQGVRDPDSDSSFSLGALQDLVFAVSEICGLTVRHVYGSCRSGAAAQPYIC